MAAQTYDSIRTAVFVMLVLNETTSGTIDTTSNANFNVNFPQALSYAENRIYRDMVLLAERRADTSHTTTAGSRLIDLTTTALPCLVVEGVALITPAGTTDPKAGTRTPFVQTQLDFIDQCWPTESITMDPSTAQWIGRYWAMKDDHTVVLSPTPDNPSGKVYTAEITGLFQPQALSATTQSTYLSTTYPELLEAAIMVWMSGAQLRNYGAASDSPQSSLSWENVYTKLLPSAIAEEQRRRSQGQGWSNQMPAVIAAPPRT